ncbi:MAG: deoxyribodipyrimidine photo-lyase, partial [Simkaniaceae bacterium]|nr:deoxyribodipyrimidine photo-lyase [Simkaniaceae bacterium]
DPKGDYVRKWVPELLKLKGKEIHEPWKCELELDYPDPIVDHKEAREKALQGFKKVK